MGSGRDWEKLAAERRMRLRGIESVHESRYALTRDGVSKAAAERLAQKIAAWKREPSIETQVEHERNLLIRGTKETRAQRDVWVRGILDACED